MLADAKAEELVRNVKRSIASCTARAFDRLAADLWPQYHVSAISIRQPPLPHLPATVREVHQSYHTTCRADGMLYHVALCAAARQRDWQVVLHHRGEALERAAEALKVSTDEVERFVDSFRRTLGAPWTAEHRHALAAAIVRLTKMSRLCVPRMQLAAGGEPG
jgi:hypothetical protein